MANGKIKIENAIDVKSMSSDFDKLTTMADNSAKGIKGVFGTIASSISNGVSKAVSGVSSIMTGAMSALKSLTGSVIGFLGANADVAGLIDNIKNVLGNITAPAVEILNNGIAKCVGSMNQLGDAFINAGVAQTVWQAAGKEFTNMFSSALDQVDRLINAIGLSFLKIWENGTGATTCQTILGILTSVSDIVDELIGGFVKAWDSADIGTSIIQKIWNVFNNLLSIVKKILDFIGKLVSMIDWKPILEGVDVISGVLEDITKIFDDGLKEILDCFLNGDFSGAGKALSDTFETAIDYVTDFIASIDWVQLGKDIAQKIGEGIAAILEYIMGIDWLGLLASVGALCLEGLWAGLQLLGTIVLELFTQMIDAITEFLGIEEASSKFMEIGVAILTGIQNGLLGIVEWFGEIFTQAWEAVCSALSGVGDFFSGCWDTIVEIFNDTVEWFGQLFSDVWDAITLPFTAIGEFFAECWDKVVAVFEICVTWFTTVFNSVWAAITGAFATVASFFSGIWKSITDIFGNVAGWFRDRFTEAWTAVKNVFSAGGQIFNGIKDGILGGLKTIVNAIISGINTVIKIPFDGINAALKSIKSVDIFGFKPFSWLGTISVPQIPKLARGGIVNRPTLAMIGEAGKEAVMPLQNNTAWMNDLADIINTRNGSTDESKVINLYLDGDKLFTWFIKAQKKQQIVLNGGLL